MTSIAAVRTEQNQIVHPQDLLALARIEDQRESAISFYLSSPSLADKSHRQEVTTVKQLEREIISSYLGQHPRSDNLHADLDAVLESTERMADGSLGFKAIFACREQNIWREFDLPTRTSIGFLKTGKRFHLVPLLRAMESCRPYCIALVEHGKARAFVVRGTLIREVQGFLSQQELRAHSVDGRGGWSHHVEGDQKEHALAYLRELSREIQRFMIAEGCADLVIGCREDLWSELAPHLNDSRSGLRGRFHLPSLGASPNEVLERAKPVFDAHQDARHAGLLNLLREDLRRSAVGIQEVHKKLDEGRIQTLLLGSPADVLILECRRCGYLPMDGIQYCAACNSTEFLAVNAQEALARKALLAGADVVPMENLALPATGEIAARLRY